MPGVFRRVQHRCRLRRRQVVATYTAPVAGTSAFVVRRKPDPQLYRVPDLTEYSRRRRRLAPRRVVAAVVGEECRLELTCIERAIFTLTLDTPDTEDTTNGRTPFPLTLVWCREDV